MEKKIVLYIAGKPFYDNYLNCRNPVKTNIEGKIGYVASKIHSNVVEVKTYDTTSFEVVESLQMMIKSIHDVHYIGS